MKPVLYVLCGLQGSGKSTYARKLEKEEGCFVVSSDEIRRQYPNAKNDTVFQMVYRLANDALIDGLNVVIDATNITVKSRRQVFANIKADCHKQCVVICTPYEKCVKRVENRNILSQATGDHFVPLEVLERYYKSFEVPFNEEGWDSIVCVQDKIVEDWAVSKLLNQADGFDQHNKHHTQDLGQHMRATSDYLVQKYAPDCPVRIAAYLHDIGKLFTQTFGEDGQAHYYNHANVGAYELLTRVEAPDLWEVVFFVNYHMHLYNVQSEKSIKKWRSLFGDKKWQQLNDLHEADVNSHAKGETKC